MRWSLSHFHELSRANGPASDTTEVVPRFQAVGAIRSTPAARLGANRTLRVAVEPLDFARDLEGRVVRRERRSGGAGTVAESIEALHTD